MENYRKLFLPVLAATASLGALTAEAASYSVTASQPSTTTNWSTPLNVLKFDGTLGTLVAVKYDLSTGVSGNVRLESFDAAPATVTYNLVAQVTLTPPASAPILIGLPTANGNFNASAYDGTFDYGGTSGISLLGLSNTDSDTLTVNGPAPAFFASLTDVNGGNDEFAVWTLAALGISNGSGAGNLVQSFNTAAEGEITVTYYYDPPNGEVPEGDIFYALAPVAVICGMVYRRNRKAKAA